MKAVLFTINEIATVLSDMCNLSFQSGIFLQLLKIASVTPIIKSGDTDNLLNYRPTSILPIFSKIFEKAAYKRLFSFCTTHNIFYKCQYGFIPKLNSTLALVDLINHSVNASCTFL